MHPVAIQLPCPELCAQTLDVYGELIEQDSG